MKLSQLILAGILIALLFLLSSCKQRPTKQTLNEADSLIDKGSYSEAAEYLEKFNLDDPANQEAHYFLGEAYYKLHCPDGSELNNTNIYFALKASDHFKRVIDISPAYKGKFYSQGPYSKITSIWGTMACTYASRGDMDSARWAFKYGQEEEGFYPEILEYNRNVLCACDSNAILFTNGDNDTFPVWFLQLMENYRKDITIINCSLLNTPWYIKQLRNKDPFSGKSIKLRFSDAQIEALNPIRWNATEISMPVPGKTLLQNDISDIYKKYNLTDDSILKDGKISWTFDPTINTNNVSALRIQDIVMKEIIEYNNWERPIYFAVTCANDNKIGLHDYLRLEGLAEQLIPQKRETGKELINKEVLRNKIDILTYNWLKSDNYKHLEEFKLMLNNYRNVFLRSSFYYLNEGDKDLAIKVLDEMESKIPNKLVQMELGLLYETGNLYREAGAIDKYNKLSNDIEKLALEKLEKDPSDLQSYYNPYKILINIYEEQGRNDKLLEIWERIETQYPDDPTVKANIEKYKQLSGK